MMRVLERTWNEQIEINLRIPVVLSGQLPFLVHTTVLTHNVGTTPLRCRRDVMAERHCYDVVC